MQTSPTLRFRTSCPKSLLANDITSRLVAMLFVGVLQDSRQHGERQAVTICHDIYKVW